MIGRIKLLNAANVMESLVQLWCRVYIECIVEPLTKDPG